MGCIFCKIAARQTKADIIYEDEQTLAFSDLNPQSPTHILVIPKKHIDSLSACTEEDIELLGKIQLVIVKIAEKLNISDAFRVVTNNGAKAGQSVKHLHYHLLAGRRFMWPPG